MIDITQNLPNGTQPIRIAGILPTKERHSNDSMKYDLGPGQLLVAINFLLSIHSKSSVSSYIVQELPG
jgi:hypothetical protein